MMRCLVNNGERTEEHCMFDMLTSIGLARLVVIFRVCLYFYLDTCCEAWMTDLSDKNR